MKRGRFFLACAVALALLCSQPLATGQPSGNPESDPGNPVTVNKIRLVIDERDMEWTEAGVTEKSGFQDAPGGGLKAETVLSFLSLSPGQMILPDTLEACIRESERRLMDSGYFYEASVLILPAKKKPEERTVLVSVTSGYLWRYGGGNAFGMMGREGLGGERASIRFFAGWNKNGAAYLHERVAGLPLVLGGRLFYFGPGNFNGKNNYTGGNRFEAASTAGIFLNPDLLLGLDTVGNGFGLTSAGLVSFEPFLRYGKYLEAGTDSDAGFSLRGFMYPKPEKAKIEANVFFHAGLSLRTVLAASASGGLSLPDLPDEAYFDLFYTDDRNVRSGYRVSELAVPTYALGTAELRHTLFDFTVPPAIDCKVHLFVFADEALLAAGNGKKNVLADAYGGGLRILFDNPIFASFTFSYGINHEGSGRFIFSGTAGF